MSEPLIDRLFLKRMAALSAIGVFGAFLGYLFSPFFTTFLGALMFSIVFKKLMTYLVETKKWHKSWSAIVIILMSFFIIFIPLLGFSYLMFSKVSTVVQESPFFLSNIQLLNARLIELTGLNIFDEKLMSQIKLFAGNLIPTFLNKLFSTLGHIVLMYFILYYLLTERAWLKKQTEQLLPFSQNQLTLLTNELDAMTLSNAIGVPLIALIQGTAAGIGYWIFGVPDPVFWALITAFVSLLPIIGSTLIWLPASAFLAMDGSLFNGIGLFLFGIIVIINIDNIARFTIQKKFADVHPLITVFGVLIGLDLFGLTGLIFGPLLISFFVLFIKMYRTAYSPTQE